MTNALDHSEDDIAWKKCEACTSSEVGPLVRHDNARPHVVHVVTERLLRYVWEVLPFASYSPNRSPPDIDYSRS
ncbi:hypothetical protein TNCV_2794371 [Trichonephila clavipes]|nr:hypothetical protein TNCV_2794371 [Trichonephila clavipes]